jgi:hypothetical protein
MQKMLMHKKNIGHVSEAEKEQATVAWIKYWQKCNTANVNKEWTHSL